MDNAILNIEVQKFINENLSSDIAKLALSKSPFPNIDFREIINQIAAKSKAKTKLPTWFKTGGILYPQKLSIEQSSSECAAEYKSNLIGGRSLIDLTGGFGVDDYYFSKRFDKVVHCEINDELSAIAQHNFSVLKAANVTFHLGDGNEKLEKSGERFDWIYIDPARRSDSKGKVFMLKDCLPEVPSRLSFYFEHSDNIMIKTAPLLDITAGLAELACVSEIHVVAVKNEVKELLWILRKGFSGRLRIFTVNLISDTRSEFDFFPDDETVIQYSLPGKYLYEPNAAILKSGGFRQVAAKFGLRKLHQHSHLYTSDELIEFPGRAFNVNEILKYGKEALKALRLLGKANITARNFPESVDQIRKALKIADGGEKYCFFTTNKNDVKIVLICTKIR